MNGADAFQPVGRFLDELIRQHGDVLFMVVAFVAIPLVIWILSGGMRRKWPRLNRQHTVIIIPPGHPPSAISAPLSRHDGEDQI